MQKKILSVCYAGLIAAMYVGLTFWSNILNLAYGAIQFRLSELLTILPIFTPAAIPGLTLGCILANLQSPMGIADIIFGSLATFLGACGTYFFRKLCIKGVPLLSLLSPVLFNAVIVGIELTVILGGEGSAAALFAYNFATVGLGELVLCVVLGTPFTLLLKKIKIFDRGFLGR